MAYLIALKTPHMAILAAKRTLKHLADEKEGWYRGKIIQKEERHSREAYAHPPLPPNPELSSIFFPPGPREGLDCAASCLRSSSGTREMGDLISICLRSYL